LQKVAHSDPTGKRKTDWGKIFGGGAASSSSASVVGLGVLSVKTHRRAATGNTRSREASGSAGGPRSLGQRPNDLAHTLA
jgi:hypothetical protein